MDHVIPVVDLIGHSLLTQATQRVKFFHRALIVRCLLLKQLLGKSYVWCEILCDVTYVIMYVHCVISAVLHLVKYYVILYYIVLILCCHNLLLGDVIVLFV